MATLEHRSTGTPAGERAQLTADGIGVDRGGRTVLSGVSMSVTPRPGGGPSAVNAPAARGTDVAFHG